MSLPWLGDLSVKAGIDYEGQKETHALYRQIVVVATSIGFLIGFFLQNFNVTVYIASSGFLLSLFVCTDCSVVLTRYSRSVYLRGGDLEVTRFPSLLLRNYNRKYKKLKNKPPLPQRFHNRRR
eukprot:TRINITY_DN103_c0_g1_i3.p1 TRINITY_DN103_c0_g1~~TRINITY_DN103_c0_g1_i3.p1  ORF type:complete len:123 (+),score=9.64 TRINITY_DN103_c0_g1_i3:149-517(+)